MSFRSDKKNYTHYMVTNSGRESEGMHTYQVCLWGYTDLHSTLSTLAHMLALCMQEQTSDHGHTHL